MKKSDLDTLSDFREKIDEIDKKIITLLAERFDVTRQVGEYKQTHSITGRDSVRESSQIAQLRMLAAAHTLDPEFIERLFRMIFDTVVANHLKIAKANRLREKS